MRDYQKEITDGIIRALEAGTAPWQKPWEAGRIPNMPYNAATNRPYRGGNVLWLMTVAASRGYEDPRWCTYKQAQERGWQVRRGEHGTIVVYWKRTETVKEKDPETGQEVRKEVPLDHPVPFHAVVFNARQIEGIPAIEPRRLTWDPIDRAEAILGGSGARILHDGGNRAFYRPSTDDIHLPERAAFRDAAGYYDTALHELGHWTGHESRLNRQFGRHGDPEYAREELRAEISSFFMAAELGLPHDPTNHASYVASWLKVLRDDKHEIFRAARDAEQITAYLLDREAKRELAADRRVEEPAEDLPKPAGIHGEKIEVRTTIAKNRYHWMPASLVDVLPTGDGGRMYEVRLDGRDFSVRVPEEDVRVPGPARGDIQIVLARVVREHVLDKEGRLDLGQRHQFKEVPAAQSLMWLNEGTEQDVQKAVAYAEETGDDWTVLTYRGEPDPLGRAKADVLRRHVQRAADKSPDAGDAGMHPEPVRYYDPPSHEPDHDRGDDR